MSAFIPAYVRISLAVMTSILVHIALLIGIMQQMKIQTPNVQGLMQVSLPTSLNNSGTESKLQRVKTTLSATKKPIRTVHKVKPESNVPKPSQTASMNAQISGHFHWTSPSSYQQSDVMNAAQLQQIAFQRKSQIAAVLDGLSTISSQLGSIITTKIICTQQVNDDIECVPEPKENERSFIIQFFNLAIQAHRLGISENPIQMNFGTTLGVMLQLRVNEKENINH